MNERSTTSASNGRDRNAQLEEREKKKTMQEKVAELSDRRAELELGGDKERIDKQHASGKLSARERVAALVDKNSFEEIGLSSAELFRRRITSFFVKPVLPGSTGWVPPFRWLLTRLLACLRQFLSCCDVLGFVQGRRSLRGGSI